MNDNLPDYEPPASLVWGGCVVMVVVFVCVGVVFCIVLAIDKLFDLF